METTTTPASKPYNPVAEAVNEKSYSNVGGATFTQEQLLQDIPEHIITAPPRMEEDDAILGNDGAKKTAPPKPEKPKPFNPDLEGATAGERQAGAETMADFAFKLYGMLHDFGNAQLKVSEKKINRLAAKGEVDLQAQVPLTLGEYVSLKDFIGEYNGQCANTFTVSEEFINTVRPPLIRELSKRGHGLTDAQTIMLFTAQDLGLKLVLFFQMKSQVNSIISFAKEHTASMRPQAARPAPSPAPTPTPEQYMPKTESIITPYTPEAATMQAEEQQQPMTVQEAAFNKVRETMTVPSGGNAMPVFGDEATLKGITKHAMENKVVVNKQKEAEKAAAKLGIPMGKKTKTGIPGAKVKGKPGPKPGSKRKPKMK